MKAPDPLLSIEEVRKRLGAPRVNISVLWVVVTQLASDLQWALAQLDTLRYELSERRRQADPVGGSDSAAPSSETEWYVAPQLPFEP